MLQPGLYEQVINHALASELAEIPQARKDSVPIDKAEASHVLAQYLTDIVQRDWTMCWITAATLPRR